MAAVSQFILQLYVAWTK